MRSTVSLRVAQPCHENWAAMSPAATGRHCAACQKTVVDFTQKTDAEILAYLARAAGTPTCGRFAAGQLERPLQRAAPVAPVRWRAWLAAAVAVWGLREGAGLATRAQVVPPQYWGGPVPATPVQPVAQNQERNGYSADNSVVKIDREGSEKAKVVFRGVVVDGKSGERLPGVIIMLPGTAIGTSTNQDGAFELMVPAEFISPKGLKIRVSSLGYMTKEKTIKRKNIAAEQTINLELQVMVLGGLAVVTPPSAWSARTIYNWGKEWYSRASGRS